MTTINLKNNNNALICYAIVNGHDFRLIKMDKREEISIFRCLTLMGFLALFWEVGCPWKIIYFS
jgi:hypothetical protein